MHDATKAAPCQPGKPGPWINASDLLEDAPLICPHAVSSTAWSDTLSATLLFVSPCRRWSCKSCGPIKCRRLAIRVENAKPTAFLTLTCWTKAYLGPRDAYDRLRRRVPELFRQLRKEFGHIEYLKVLESTKHGFPHWHAMVRGPYLPQQRVSELWDHYAQSPIVDVREIKQLKSVYAYTVGYLLKQEAVPWTKRRISWSKAFFASEEKPDRPELNLRNHQRFKCHPYELLRKHHRNHEVRSLSRYILEIADHRHGCTGGIVPFSTNGVDPCSHANAATAALGARLNPSGMPPLTTVPVQPAAGSALPALSSSTP